MTRDLTELALAPRAADTLPALVIEPDRQLQDAWRVACEWCGPSRSEIGIREFLRGMIFSPGTWSVLEREYRVDMREASAAVARDSDSGLSSDGPPLAMNSNLRRLLGKAGARVLEAGHSEITTKDVVETLWDMPGEEQHCGIFPGFVVRSAERMAASVAEARAKEAYEAVAIALPKQLEALAADTRHLKEQAAPLAQIAAMKQAVDQLAAALTDAPGLDIRADRLSKSFGGVHEKLRDLSGALQQQRAVLEAAAKEQRAVIDAHSETLADLDHKTLNWRWWRKR